MGKRFHSLHFKASRMARRAVSLMMLGGLLLNGTTLISLAQSVPSGPMIDPGPKQAADNKPVRGQISITNGVNIASDDKKFSLNMRDTNLRDVLNMLAMEGGFNLILHESVDGTLTVDVKDISIDKALEYIFTVADLSYSKDGNTLIVANRSVAEEKNMTAKTFKAIPVLYKDAEEMANILNETIFSFSRAGGKEGAAVSFDPDSNSILIMGTDADIELAASALRELDFPRNRKVYHIKHNTPEYVAEVLAANFFESGDDSGGSGSSSSSSSSSGSSSSGGGSSSSSAASSGGSTGATGSSGSQEGPTVIETGGVKLISDPMSATLTVLGTDEQIALVDSIIDMVDVKRPQVAIEVALVELQSSKQKNFIPEWDGVRVGREGTLSMLQSAGNTFTWSKGTNNYLGGNPFAGGGSFFDALTNPRTYIDGITITHNNSHSTGRVLANPTLVALDGTTSTIDITDQLESRSITTSVEEGVVIVTTEITTVDAGVSLSITPTINHDGSVLMNIQPTVSQPIREVFAGDPDDPEGEFSSTWLISSRTMNIGAARVKDGQTLIIGGLLKENSSIQYDKMPGLADLPIVGAMFRTTDQNRKDRSELVLMVTPHIIKDQGVAYFEQPGSPYTSPATYRQNNLNQGVVQPVSLPRYVKDQTDTNLHPAVDTSSSGEAKIQMKNDATGEGKAESGAAESESFAALSVEENPIPSEAAPAERIEPVPAEPAKPVTLNDLEKLEFGEIVKD